MKRSRIVAAFAAPAVIAALTLAGAGAANAAVKPANTGSCGPQCLVFSYETTGTNIVLKDSSGVVAVNNGVNVNTRETTGIAGMAEDFLPQGDGTVVPLYCNTNGTSTNGLLSNRQCVGLEAAGYSSDTAFQLRYEPDGTNTRLCAGLWNNEAVATDGFRIREENCGVAGDTLWIADSQDAKFIGGHEYTPYINGASDNFSSPEVATEVEAGGSLHYQRVEQLNVDSSGFVDNDQLLTAAPGL